MGCELDKQGMKGCELRAHVGKALCPTPGRGYWCHLPGWSSLCSLHLALGCLWNVPRAVGPAKGGCPSNACLIGTARDVTAQSSSVPSRGRPRGQRTATRGHIWAGGYSVDDMLTAVGGACKNPQSSRCSSDSFLLRVQGEPLLMSGCCKMNSNATTRCSSEKTKPKLDSKTQRQ
jgi:hypothetical protein